LVVIGKSLATFQKSKSTWSTVGSTSLPLAGPSRNGAGDEEMEDIKPDIEAEQEKEKKAATKLKGGLRTAAQIREEAEALKAERAAELAALQAEQGEGAGGGQQEQTVHRDSTGRKVDVEKLKREAKEKEEEEKRKAREREEWSKGMVQREGREARAREEREMGERDVAR
jgi:pre-mRNA-splicing factor CWC26